MSPCISSQKRPPSCSCNRQGAGKEGGGVPADLEVTDEVLGAMEHGPGPRGQPVVGCLDLLPL